MADTFTVQDIDLLMQGLDAITKAESSSDFNTLMIGAMLSKEDAETQAKKFEAKMEQRRRERAERDEQIILVKAKLIQVKRDAREESARLIVEQSLAQSESDLDVK